MKNVEKHRQPKSDIKYRDKGHSRTNDIFYRRAVNLISRANELKGKSEEQQGEHKKL